MGKALSVEIDRERTKEWGRSGEWKTDEESQAKDHQSKFYEYKRWESTSTSS